MAFFSEERGRRDVEGVTLARMNWEDVRAFLAVARAGSVSRAARASGLNPSTLTRRLVHLEEHLGVRLYDRLPTGYALTDLGEQLRARCEDLETAMAAVVRDISNHTSELSGSVAVSVPDGVGPLTLSGLDDFFLRYPDIEVEIMESDVPADLDKRHADIVLRAATQPPPPHWVGRKAARCRSWVYASRGYLKHHPPGSQQKIIVDSRASEGRVPDWASHVKSGVVLRSTSRSTRLQAVLAGVGMAALPEPLVSPHPEIVKIESMGPVAEFDLWVLIHPSLRETPRVRVLQEFLVRYYGRFA